jgi:hypothetical protein
MKRCAAAVVACVAVSAVGGCVIDRKAACVAAQECDLARDAPYGDFNDDDDAFGATGSCWQTEESAAPCEQACNDFLAEQLADATAKNDLARIVACGG